MYNNEIEIYKDIIPWLENRLKGDFGRKAKKITVLDTHDSDLSNFIIKLKYQRFFTDFTTSTTVGTAVDRFNEVLKGLAPGAAPSLDDMDCDDSGTKAKLSFGSSKTISSLKTASQSSRSLSNPLTSANNTASPFSHSIFSDIHIALKTFIKYMSPSGL